MKRGIGFCIIIGMVLSFSVYSQEIPHNINNVRGQFFSIILPEGWAKTNNHEYLKDLDESLGFDIADEHFSRMGFTDTNNNDNFLYVAEMAIPNNIPTEELMRMINSPAKKTIIGSNEFFTINEPFFDSTSTVRSAFIVKNNVWFSFIFILSNSNLEIADRAFESIFFRKN